jgi:molybdopterin synthase sulfur carrier subunit
MAEGDAHVQILLPYALRAYADGRESVEVGATTLAEAVDALNRRFPGLAYRILDDQGRLRRFVHAFVNDEPVSHLAPEAIALRDRDVVTILPSVAGG